MAKESGPPTGGKPPAEPAALDEQELATARKRFTAALAYTNAWKEQAQIDLKWCAGVDGDRSYQWSEVVQQQRDLQQRPFNTINRLPSFIKQVTNQQRQASPDMNVVPLKGEVSAEEAEVRQGLLRHTMLISDGEVHVDTAFEDMAIHGKGYCEVITRYEDESNEDTEDQELYIEWRDPFTVYLDPAAQRLDKSDMKYAFVPFDFTLEDYKLLWPNSALANADNLVWQGMDPGERTNWFPNGGVRVARYYTVEQEAETKKREDGSTRTLTTKYVRRRLINAFETLEDVKMRRGKYAVKRIPIVPMLGDRYVIDGKEDYRGMIRLARQPQQTLNFWITSLSETIAAASKSPWIIGWSQLEGFEDIWKNANTSIYGALPYRDKSPDGTPGNPNPPIRNVQEPAIQAIVTAIRIANDSLDQIMQLYDPSLGKGKAEQSGAAIQSLQQQGEIGNSHYIDNLKRFYRSLGRLLLQMYPVYFDQARVMRIIGKDNRPLTVMVHAGEDNAPDPQELADLEMEAASVFDLAVGHYDIVVSTGPSFLSRRQEANANILQILKMAPQLMPMLMDVFFENSDMPGAMELAERAKKTISAPFQAQDAGDPQQQLLKLKGALQQFMQQHDLLVKELNAKNQYIQTDQAKYDAQIEIKKYESSMQVELQKLKNAATIAVAEINAQTKGVISQNEQQHEQIALLMGQAHEAAMADQAQAHDVGMAQVDHASTSDQMAQDHGQTLAQNAQQAALAPPPADQGSADQGTNDQGASA